MTTTWGEIKDSLYRLMYLSSAEEDDYDKYLLSAANFAINEIAVKVSPLHGEYRILQARPKNLLKAELQRLYSISSQSTLQLSGENVRSLAFSYMGECTFSVYQEDTLCESASLSSPYKYSDYSLTLTQNARTKIEFAASTHLIVANIGMYDTAFSASAPTATDFVSYDIGSLLAAQQNGDKFYCFDNTAPILREGESMEAPIYFIKRPSTIALSASERGVFCIRYLRLPKSITADTADTEAIDLDDAAAGLVPLLMAWRIFKDDDERKAAMYYNEYQQARSELARTKELPAGVYIAGGREL